MNKDNSGASFKNDRKESEKQPDLTGTVMVDGSEYYMSTWKNISKDGKPYLSHKFTPKMPAQQPAQQAYQQPAQQQPAQDFDDMPF